MVDATSRMRASGQLVPSMQLSTCQTSQFSARAGGSHISVHMPLWFLIAHDRGPCCGRIWCICILRTIEFSDAPRKATLNSRNFSIVVVALAFWSAAKRVSMEPQLWTVEQKISNALLGETQSRFWDEQTDQNSVLSVPHGSGIHLGAGLSAAQFATDSFQAGSHPYDFALPVPAADISPRPPEYPAEYLGEIQQEQRARLYEHLQEVAAHDTGDGFQAVSLDGALGCHTWIFSPEELQNRLAELAGAGVYRWHSEPSLVLRMGDVRLTCTAGTERQGRADDRDMPRIMQAPTDTPTTQPEDRTGRPKSSRSAKRRGNGRSMARRIGYYSSLLTLWVIQSFVFGLIIVAAASRTNIL